MTAEEIANKWTMKRHRTASHPEGHSDSEFFQMIAEEIKEELYYIQDTRTFHGNAVVWWGVDGRGYTSDFRNAGKYTKEKAMKICERESDRAWPVEYIDNNIQATKVIIDMQYLEI